MADVTPEVEVDHLEAINPTEAVEKERAKNEPVLKTGNAWKVFRYRLAKVFFVDLLSIGGIAAIAYSAFNCMMIMPMQVTLPHFGWVVGFATRPSDDMMQNSQWINLLLWFNVVNKNGFNKLMDGISEMLKNWKKA